MAPLSCRRIFRAGGVCVQFPGMRLRVRTYTGIDTSPRGFADQSRHKRSR